MSEPWVELDAVRGGLARRAAGGPAGPPGRSSDASAVDDLGEPRRGRRCSRRGGWSRRGSRRARGRAHPTSADGRRRRRRAPAKSTSVMTSPTSTRPVGEALGREVAHGDLGRGEHRSAAWSVSTRLCSSGMRRLNERRPASRCATRQVQLHGATARRRASSWCRRRRAPSRGGARRARASSAASIAPVCTPWLPEPTPRCTSGAGMPRSSKKTSESIGS